MEIDTMLAVPADEAVGWVAAPTAGFNAPEFIQSIMSPHTISQIFFWGFSSSMSWADLRSDWEVAMPVLRNGVWANTSPFSPEGARAKPEIMLASILEIQSSKLLDGPVGATAPMISNVSSTRGSGVGGVPGMIPLYATVTLVFAMRYSVIPVATADMAEDALFSVNLLPSVPIAPLSLEIILSAKSDLLMVSSA